MVNPNSQEEGLVARDRTKERSLVARGNIDPSPNLIRKMWVGILVIRRGTSERATLNEKER